MLIVTAVVKDGEAVSHVSQVKRDFWLVTAFFQRRQLISLLTSSLLSSKLAVI